MVRYSTDKWKYTFVEETLQQNMSQLVSSISIFKMKNISIFIAPGIFNKCVGVDPILRVIKVIA